MTLFIKKTFLFSYIVFFSFSCSNTKVPFEIIEADLKSEIYKFEKEAKLSKNYVGKYISLDIVVDENNKYLIALINDPPNGCNNYFGTIKMAGIEVSLYSDSSIVLKENPIVRIKNFKPCDLKEEKFRFYCCTLFEKEFHYKEGSLTLQDSRGF